MAKALVSDGLAVSYFYNFVKRALENVDTASEVLMDGEVLTFPGEEVSIEVILPAALRAEEIDKCKMFVFRNTEVKLVVPEGRDMSFFVEDLRAAQKKIIDFPTAIGAVIDFFKIDIENLSGFIDLDTESTEWQERETAELNEFKAVLDFLVASYPSTQNRVTVRFLEE